MNTNATPTRTSDLYTPAETAAIDAAIDAARAAASFGPRPLYVRPNRSARRQARRS
jgi:hypothetical protein